ncbi:GNAT family N-acetyltransferase [Cohnella herbarum]|uniref:GNAT family N-acetyltransferase n=1 Tax=Cohnella herbarum TaxID=2728023 RepID=A0A7Z2ZLS2_9BACL|nr:GNAT family N-acetyltransferase [Cohnella herbarum]QJD84308.1 GNAT family N-acetyltransferase [Cohnella herbarum]
MSINAVNIKRRDIAEEVWALQHSAYRIEAQLIGVSDLPPLQDTVQTLQACEETFLGYMDAEGELLGAVSFERDRLGKYSICRLMVHPEHMRRGIGGALLEHLLRELPHSATCSVTAEIRNLPAIALYERFGFARHDTFKPIPGIEMVRLVRKPRGN